MLKRLLFFLVIFFPGALLAQGEPLLTGNFIQGGLVKGQIQPGAMVKVDGQQVRVSDQGLFLVGFGRDAEPQSILRIEYPNGKVVEQTLKVKKREYDIQRIDGLPPRKVTPKEEDLKRIRKESALTRKARKLDDERTDFTNGFEWPALGRISGVYGSQRILNGEPRRPHFGIDIAAPVGTAVKSPAPGVVTLAHRDMFFSGATLIVDHGHGLSSTFLHLDRILVEEGQRVGQGELIAELGASGRVTGAHLDWRINLFTKRLDPQLLVGPMPKK